MLVMVLAFLAVVSGCKEKTIELLPEVNLQTHELEVDPDGGSYSVGYSVDNPSSEGVLELSKGVDWITELTSTDLVVSFNVSSNPGGRSFRLIRQILLELYIPRLSGLSSAGSQGLYRV